MSSIIIEIDGKSLPYVQADLRFRESNNSFTDQLELPHAKFPIRIPENDEVADILGPASMPQARKQRNYDCQVIIGQNRYEATLEVIDYKFSYRAADLSYNNVLKTVLSKKLYKFFTNINVKGDHPELVPYSDVSDSDHNAQDEFNTIAISNLYKTFPEIDWQLPAYRHDDRIDQKEKDIGEDFAFLREFINGRDAAGDLFLNDYTVTTSEFEVRNRNIIAPQVFVMAAIKNAVASIGYTLSGEAAFHVLLKSLLFYSEEDQLTAIQRTTPGTDFPAFNVNWENIWFSVQIPAYRRRTVLAPGTTGTFNVNIKFEWPATTVTNRLCIITVNWQGAQVFEQRLNDPQDFQESVNIEVSAGQINDNIEVTLIQLQRNPAPSLQEVILVKDQEEGKFYDVHPTIDFRRYLPDWTVAELLKNLAIFNIKPIIDDVSKELKLVFNETNYLFKRDAVIINGSRNLRNFSNVLYDAIVLKYENEDDNYIRVDQDSTEVNGDITVTDFTIESNFKKVPLQSGTAFIDQDFIDISGVGFMIYNPINAPFISNSINEFSLSMDSNFGIYNRFWKAWASMLLDGSRCNLTLNTSSTLLNEVLKKQDLFVNGMRFLVVDSDYKPAAANRYDVDLTLISVNI
jgi:hypothetical protein